MTKEKLIAKAEEAGVEIDKRWGADKIAAAIEAGADAPAEPTTPVLLSYDTWDAAGNRRKAGETIDIAVSAARQLIADGKAERADPLPGEG
jgi:hypothetical protein